LLKPEEVTGLSERIAIIFAPGVPPIWTTLVRYYERAFHRRAYASQIAWIEASREGQARKQGFRAFLQRR
jgi:type IV secretory pathway TraG/TraD family ATPase VirD4